MQLSASDSSPLSGTQQAAHLTEADFSATKTDFPGTSLIQPSLFRAHRHQAFPPSLPSLLNRIDIDDIAIDKVESELKLPTKLL